MSKKLFVLNLFNRPVTPCQICSTRNYAVAARKHTNLFELYSNNPSWLGVYQRHPLRKEPVTQHEIRNKVEEEIESRRTLSLETIIDTNSATWSESSQRVGAIGRKLGSSNLWTKNGFNHQVTLVQIEDCQVLDTQISCHDGGRDIVTQMIVGACDITDTKTIANLPRDHMIWYDERGLFPKQYWHAFPATKDALLLPGTQITAAHFQPGQYVTVRGRTFFHGFQGVMKKWGMKGQPASHGQTKTHRKMGATGGGGDPGRVFPGKEMPGCMGGKFSTIHGLKIMRVNTKHNMLYVKGVLPGEVGSFVVLRDWKQHKFTHAPPFPTHNRNDVEENLYAGDVYSEEEPSLRFEGHKL